MMINRPSAVDFTPETNAALYVLVPFVNPIDCGLKISFNDDQGQAQQLIVPMNRNHDLESWINGDRVNGASFRPSWFSKRCLQSHLHHRQTYYYRSRPNGFVRTGFGNSSGSIARML